MDVQYNPYTYTITVKLLSKMGQDFMDIQGVV